jgi:hypothetical protein
MGSSSQMLLRLATAGAAVILSWTAPAAASAAAEREDRLWATVNVCDTRDHPDEIGIRASMPGLERRATMHMRFRVQYYATVAGEWRDFTSGSRTDSGWLRVGRQRRGTVESGFSVRFKPPANGGAHRLRGKVSFRWRRGGRVVRRAREITEAGHRSTAGADPPNYSAAACLLS